MGSKPTLPNIAFHVRTDLPDSISQSHTHVPGSPTKQGGKIVDPLTEQDYKLHFVGIQGEEVKTDVLVQKKIWFDGESLNK